MRVETSYDKGLNVKVFIGDIKICDYLNPSVSLNSDGFKIEGDDLLILNKATTLQRLNIPELKVKTIQKLEFLKAQLSNINKKKIQDKIDKLRV